MALTREEKVNLAESVSKISGGSVAKSYWQHAVKYGDYLDVRTYKDVKITFNGIDTSKFRTKEGSKRNDSIARSKVRVYRLVVGNIYRFGRYRPIFATYTFKNSITNLDEAISNYKRYLARLRAYLGYNPKFVTVPQIQWKRFELTGQKVWHFHTVFLNVSKIDFKVNDKMWGQGDNAVNLQYVRGIRNVGAYLAGYFTKKDFDEIPKNRRFYYCSKGLIQPQEFFHRDTIAGMIESGRVKVLSVYEGVKYSQIKYKL